MVNIVPAILPKSFGELEDTLAKLRGIASLVQVDMVGVNVFEGKEAFPFWEEFDFECDIMLPDPLHEIQSCIDMGASRIVVHANAKTAKEAVVALQEFRGGSFPTLVGVALASHDTLDALAPYENLYDFVQVMGIDHIGRQGEPPDPHHKELELLRALRSAYPNLPLQVDGAAAAHPKELVDAGANILVVGGAIINAEDPKEVIEKLYNQANAC